MGTINLTTKNHLRVDSQLDSKNIRGYSLLEYIQKRIVDGVIAFLLLLVSCPIIVLTIYKIKKQAPGPIFFKQPRVGKDGKLFTCYKFRSMYVDSPFNRYTEDNDSRIFPFGSFMRKTRIDELPQLLNVLKGEMHIVGPRAEWDILVKEYEKEIPNYDFRHKVAPGITGLAQVRYPYGRNLYDTKKKFNYDIMYIENWNIFLEIKILLETVFVILGKKGL